MDHKINKMRIIPISEINAHAKEAPLEYILQCEGEYRNAVADSAANVKKELANKPIILLSGPSGSGKTTTAHRMGYELKKHGVDSIIISMDDYYAPGEPTVKLPDGRIDFESPELLDSKLLGEHLEILANGGSITLPVYDFKSRERLEGKKVTRKKNTVVIIEGIHALNPEVTGGHHDFASFMYVSVRTRISDSSGVLLHPSKIRLMRRLTRDKLFRGMSFEATAAKYTSVQRGENIYIMPYKHFADYEIDTFMPYEACVYRELIPQITENCDENGYSMTYGELPHFVQLLQGINRDIVPEKSLIREFIG